MIFHSTKNVKETATAEEAIFRGLPPDNGLYMPVEIPRISKHFWEEIEKKSFQEIALEIAKVFVGREIDELSLKSIINTAINFKAPVFQLEGESLYCLELFHGPSMAFKDFGARFMAGLMSHFLKKENRQIHILVATSGDTGGAVAQGFYESAGIHVHILYPSGKVSGIQEKQLTTLGKNVIALEVDGTFDDCQKLVKQAFLDEDLQSSMNLASANSINIARLIPQAFYYVMAYKSLKKFNKSLVFSVPSGNFGNLCAGVLATRLGMPGTSFIAATNANKVVPDYLKEGKYEAISPSIATISNAMDVGNPSNFPRLTKLFDDKLDSLRSKVSGAFYSDAQTRSGIKELYEKYNYVACPHTAIGYLALRDRGLAKSEIGVFLGTAHYAKFLDEVEPVLQKKLSIPQRLADLENLSKKALTCSTSYEQFKAYLKSQV